MTFMRALSNTIASATRPLDSHLYGAATYGGISGGFGDSYGAAYSSLIRGAFEGRSFANNNNLNLIGGNLDKYLEFLGSVVNRSWPKLPSVVIAGGGGGSAASVAPPPAPSPVSPSSASTGSNSATPAEGADEAGEADEADDPRTALISELNDVEGLTVDPGREDNAIVVTVNDTEADRQRAAEALRSAQEEGRIPDDTQIQYAMRDTEGNIGGYTEVEGETIEERVNNLIEILTGEAPAEENGGVEDANVEGSDEAEGEGDEGEAAPAAGAPAEGTLPEPEAGENDDASESHAVEVPPAAGSEATPAPAVEPPAAERLDEEAVQTVLADFSPNGGFAARGLSISHDTSSDRFIFAVGEGADLTEAARLIELYNNEVGFPEGSRFVVRRAGGEDVLVASADGLPDAIRGPDTVNPAPEPEAPPETPPSDPAAGGPNPPEASADTNAAGNTGGSDQSIDDRLEAAQNALTLDGISVDTNSSSSGRTMDIDWSSRDVDATAVLGTLDSRRSSIIAALEALPIEGDDAITITLPAANGGEERRIIRGSNAHERAESVFDTLRSYVYAVQEFRAGVNDQRAGNFEDALGHFQSSYEARAMPHALYNDIVCRRDYYEAHRGGLGSERARNCLNAIEEELGIYDRAHAGAVSDLDGDLSEIREWLTSERRRLSETSSPAESGEAESADGVVTFDDVRMHFAGVDGLTVTQEDNAIVFEVAEGATQADLTRIAGAVRSYTDLNRVSNRVTFAARRHGGTNIPAESAEVLAGAIAALSLPVIRTDNPDEPTTGDEEGGGERVTTAIDVVGYFSAPTASSRPGGGYVEGVRVDRGGQVGSESLAFIISDDANLDTLIDRVSNYDALRNLDSSTQIGIVVGGNPEPLDNREALLARLRQLAAQRNLATFLGTCPNNAIRVASNSDSGRVTLVWNPGQADYAEVFLNNDGNRTELVRLLNAVVSASPDVSLQLRCGSNPQAASFGGENGVVSLVARLIGDVRSAVPPQELPPPPAPQPLPTPPPVQPTLAPVAQPAAPVPSPAPRPVPGARPPAAVPRPAAEAGPGPNSPRRGHEARPRFSPPVRRGQGEGGPDFPVESVPADQAAERQAPLDLGQLPNDIRLIDQNIEVSQEGNVLVIRYTPGNSSGDTDTAYRLLNSALPGNTILPNMLVPRRTLQIFLAQNSVAPIRVEGPDGRVVGTYNGTERYLGTIRALRNIAGVARNAQLDRGREEERNARLRNVERYFDATILEGPDVFTCEITEINGREVLVVRVNRELNGDEQRTFNDVARPGSYIPGAGTPIAQLVGFLDGVTFNNMPIYVIGRGEDLREPITGANRGQQTAQRVLDASNRISLSEVSGVILPEDGE